MKPLILTGVRDAVIVAPHSDDETIGAHGLSGLLVRRGVRVRVLVVSDGAASHANSRLWPRERLVRTRRDESRRAMRRLGVGAGAVTFLGLPDGGLAGLSRFGCRTLSRAIARRRTGLLVLPSAQDDHADHRAVAAVAAKVLMRARRLEYPVWPARYRPRGANVSLHLGRDLAVKRHALKTYRTQMGLIADDPAGFAISRTQLHCFCRPVETFRVIAR